jgi:chitinase
MQAPLCLALLVFASGCATAPTVAEAPPAVAAAEENPESADAPELGKPILGSPTEAAAPEGPIVLGYFTNWAHYRKAPCDFKTEDVDAKLFSHINYAFALVETDDDKELYRVIPSNKEDESRLFGEVNALKKQNPDLRTFLSVGGWAFNDKPTEWIFSAMAETKERRGSFIRHATEYARKHGFDGIDIDWEFPGAPDRGGRPVDTKNFTALLKEFRAHFAEEAKTSGKDELLLTIASPAGPHFRKHLEVGEIHKWLNWINVMTYDYHGNWEKQTGANAPLEGEAVSVSANIKEFKEMGVPSNKLVLGMATYARGWGGVEEAKPGAKATGNGPDGPCGKESFAAYQVEELIKEGKYVGAWDDKTKTPYAYSKDLKAYLSYDDKKSIGLKLEFLKEEELAGAMFWAIDLDNFKNGFPIISQVSQAVRAPQPEAGPAK